VTATSDVPSISQDQGSRCIVNENVAAVAAQHQVQHQQNLRRSPAPVAATIAMSSSCTQAAASSRPDSRIDGSFSQDHSSLPSGFGIFGSGSAISLTGLSGTGSSLHRRPKNPFLLLQFGVYTIPDHFRTF